jgi:transposase
MEGGADMKSTTIAVDLAKSVFEVAISDRPGQVHERHRLSRERFQRWLAERAPATIVMEACGSAHHWARRAQGHGHLPILVPPHVVRAYVLRNKTDRADAKGLLEAFRNEDVRPVPVKSETQQALVALHRLRATGLATRTARLNTVRGLLREFGVVIPTGAHRVVPHLRMLLEDADSPVPGLLRPALAQAADEIREIEARVKVLDRQLEHVAQASPLVTQLRTVPGIGVVTGTALVATVGDVTRFPSGRHFASYLGLTPREDSSALRRRLGAISKRGDTYLRMLLIHGARSVLSHAKLKTTAPPDRLRTWALQLERRRGSNKAAVAVANKVARTVWAVWRHGTDYIGRPAV